MGRLLKILGCLATVALLVSLVVGQTPDMEASGLSVRWYTGMAVALVGTQLWVVWFFLSGLRNYQPRLRLTYFVLVAGILLLGVAQLQLPIITSLQLLDSWWIASGLILVPFALSSVANFLSATILTRTLGLRSWVTRPWPVIAGVTVACVASSAFPHLRITGTPGSELQFDVFVALTVWMLLFSTTAAGLFWWAMRSIGPLYVRPLRWLVGALVLAALGSLTELVYSLSTPVSRTWYTHYGLNLLPLVLMSITLLVAGVLFKQLSQRRIRAAATPVDVIIYMAQLVSEPKEIDHLLESLRDITARGETGQPVRLNPTDERAIAKLYQAIETYLIHKEPVRKFNRDELRALLPESFGALLVRSAR